MVNRKSDARRRVPSIQEVMDLPPAAGGIFFMTEKEIKTLRSRVYTLNRDNAFNWRWRTMVDGQDGRYSQLLIWRIH
jgi:hypothetical protein